jgi:hypothetical protein
MIFGGQEKECEEHHGVCVGEIAAPAQNILAGLEEFDNDEEKTLATQTGP